MQIDIQIETQNWENQKATEQENVEKAIKQTLLACDKYRDDYEISITFTDDKTIKQLNKHWRGKDKATNVLSFPQDTEDTSSPFAFHLGDIVLAFETIERESNEQKKSFNDHLSHLLIHGTLHLLGHDHEIDEEAEIMEQLEIDILSKMGIKNPYE